MKKPVKADIPFADFPVDEQRVMIQFLLTDQDAFFICRPILKAEYFDPTLQKIVKMVLDFFSASGALPPIEQIHAMTGVQIEKLSEITPTTRDNWFLPRIEKFCRYRAIELAVLEAADLIETGNGGEIERIVKDAVSISLMRDLGTNYYEDPHKRLMLMKDRALYIPTGWRAMDDRLYGGFTPGSLHVFAGGSGAGKSILLQNIALNWSRSGMNVIYITLELPEPLVSMRWDSMISGLPTNKIFSNMNTVAQAVRARSEKAGILTVKKFPEAGTNTNVIRAFIKEWEGKTGKRLDGICIDYLDLMAPLDSTIRSSDMFVKDKYTSEEMRALAAEYEIPCATASQLNRSSVETSEFDHSHIAGGISKINTADGVYAILATPAMKEKGEYELQFMKTRSSSGVGQKIKLRYHPETMLLEDMEQVEARPSREEQRNILRDKTQTKSAPWDDEKTKPESDDPMAVGASSIATVLRNKIKTGRNLP